MSAAPLFPPSYNPSQTPDSEAGPVLCAADAVTLQAADQDECVVNRLGGARGALAGITVGAMLWIGIILAGAALIRK